MVNKQSSSEEKKQAAEAVFELLGQAFFEEVTFLTAPGNTNSGGSDITSTTTFGVGARVPDTSVGKHLSHDKRTRFRTNMYIGGAASEMEEADFYVLLLATWTSTTAPSTSDITGSLESFVGIHCLAGDVTLVSKGDGRFKETTSATSLSGDTTYKIEFQFSGTSLDVLIDDKPIGSISRRHNRGGSEIVLYPIIAPIRSVNGTGVTINMENYQLLQDR